MADRCSTRHRHVTPLSAVVRETASGRVLAEWGLCRDCGNYVERSTVIDTAQLWRKATGAKQNPDGAALLCVAPARQSA